MCRPTSWRPHRTACSPAWVSLLARYRYPGGSSVGPLSPPKGGAGEGPQKKRGGGGGSMRAEKSDLAHNVIDFTRLLRANEFPVSPAEVHDALRAVGSIDIGDKVDFYLALRSVLLWSPDRAGVFDALFQRFWGGWSDELTRESSIPS